ncbi:hypothetical protein F5Y16DRAFT_416957 [Xylariaceae sp. FL0255]|nr:hypothetical protein F5Y16DRAFT_416957 [Xylariaceae sp. FL0255]
MLSLGIEDQTDIGIAVGLGNTFRLPGGSVATTLYTAVYRNKFDTAIPASSRQAINTAAAYMAVNGTTPELVSLAEKATKMDYVKGFSLVYLISILFSVLAIIAYAYTVSVDMAKKNNSRATS